MGAVSECAEHQLASALVTSDRSYFELGAMRHPGDGVAVLHMPELADVAAGCVAVCDRMPANAAAAAARVRWVEAAIRDLGAPRYRWYDNTASPVMADCLRSSGYVASREIGLIGERVPALDMTELTIRQVASDRDWEAKLALHRSDPKAPDGHVVPAERWLAMERRKHDAGNLEFYLAEYEGEVCGTVGAMQEGRMLRMKNIVVAAPWRNRGVGTALTAAMIGCARDRGHRALGLFALAGGPAVDIYRRLGMVEVVEQTEWVKSV